MSVGELSLLLLLLLVCVRRSSTESLRPSNFNLAREKHVTVSATSTCGEFLDKDNPNKIEHKKELYCKLTGSSPYEKDYKDSNLIYGQYCDHCDFTLPDKKHIINYTIDGTDRWWQSPPLSRGLEYQKVNITINLGQEYHITYVYIRMANSPRPAVWSLERSSDYGKTFQTWYYFANDVECRTVFGVDPSYNRSFGRDDDVVCETKYAGRIPLESGEMLVSLVNDRPNIQNFSHSDTLQQWTRATHVRIRLLRPTTLHSHSIIHDSHDKSVTRRYFYSIRDIGVGGHCRCNGHAESCDKPHPKTPNKMVCRCRHNTCGDYCQECCEPYVQKKWRQSRDSGAGAFECEPCQCYGHATECVYDEKIAEERLSIDIHGNYEGGGRCLNCQHNTEGINCHRCVRGFFRNFTRKVSDVDMCQPCKCNPKVSTGACAEGTGKCECKPQFTGLECDECAVGYFDYAAGCKPCLCSVNGTADHKCLPDSGRCVCKMNFDGDFCDRCAPGYYNFKAGCLPCACERAGSDGNICDAETGQCPCRLNYQNRTCNECKNGHYGYPGCLPCVCNHNGSTTEVCHKETGTCLCKANFTGQTCEHCAPGFFNHPICEACACDPVGVIYDACDQRGQCHCKANFGGRQCNQCAPGYYRYPECIPCACDMHGSVGLSCDQTTGQCVCKSNFVGNKCQECAPGLFNFPYCEECKCVPAGVRNDFPGCGRHNIPGVLCLCKQNVEGRQCDRCKEGFWNLKASNPLGCEPCECSESGTLAQLNTCDPVIGQCSCKYTTKNSTLRCDVCADGYYGLKRDDVFGCEPCRCSLGGSLHSVCDKQTGQCVCRPSIVGRECNQPAYGHFFPTLHHLQYELEDGLTVRQQTPVRYEFDTNEFDSYSWKGYVRYSTLQSEVQLPIQLAKPTAYRLLVRYRTYNKTSIDSASLEYKVPQINVNFSSVTETGTGTVQTFDMELPQSDQQVTFATAPSLLTSEAAPNNEYSLIMKTTDPVLIDYVVFVPIDYAEAQALQQTDTFATGRPCELDDEEECYQYTYPPLTGMSSVSQPSSGVSPSSLLIDSNLLQELAVDSMTTIERARDYRYDWMVPKAGQYYLVVDYHTIDAGTSYARAQTIDGDMVPGSLVLTECPYTFVCRQLVTTLINAGNQRINKPKIMTVTDSRRATVIITVVQQTDRSSPIGIQKITAVPVSQFSFDLLRPQFTCVRGTSDDGPHGLPMCDETNQPPSQTATAPIQIFQAEDYYNEHLRTSQFPSAPPNTAVVPMNFTTPNIYVYGRLSDAYADPTQYPATFQFHIHYYQSQSFSPSERIPLTVIFYSRTGDSQIGEIQAPICQRRTPGGCSQLVTLQNGSTAIRLDEPEFTAYLSLANPNTSLLIDYLTAQKIEPKVDVPVTTVVPVDAEGDRASKFVQECIAKTAPNFDLKISQASPFCRQALYSLSATFNERAVSCQCDQRGSTDPSGQCDPYGGQCSCRPHVIGRRCDRCRTGYWGFPNCRPCTCPTKICNEINGNCICPPRVTGRYCDQCVSRTYGFDPLIGCEDCQCRIEGVLHGRLECDLRTGQCPCRDTISGRTCDRCLPGHYDYPLCKRCDCDAAGTLICDTHGGACTCKEHVFGPRCDRCNSGTFALAADNPKGCTNCYCFGSTSQCQAGLFNYRNIRNMSEWTLTRPNIRSDRRDARLTMMYNDDPNDPTPIYWSAPRQYLGNKILAYGGNLTFKFSYSSSSNTHDPTFQKHPLIVLRGRDLTIAHFHPRPLHPNRPDEEISVTLKEANFRFQTRSSAAVTRDTFLQTLSNLSSLHILAWPHSADSSSSSIVAVQLHVADLKTSGNISHQRPIARSIEVCACPPNYAGTSCETCARGHYKQYSGTNGAHSFTCVPCQCNGHSEACDVETGTCLACQDQTIGAHCEQCRNGYHGDPTQNIPCRLCACPLPVESNSFASACEMNITTGETTKCFCKQGYYGDRCQSCYPAFWGEPNRVGSRCTPCECNGNIDPFDWNACDQQTGRCVNCLNNTAGSTCERCRDWFYGDAIQAKNCAPCSCSQCGSTLCDQASGRCQCKPGVTGLNCDVCLENHYGYHACNDEGCKPCACGLGSIGASCDLYTGQCQCKPGVGGRKCDTCLPGYWDLTMDGCKPCQCDRFGTVRDLSNTGLSCDAQTGRCYCIEGVRGERCDQCEEFYTIVEGRGCLPCDKSNVVPEGWCARQLIDEVDHLRVNINRTIENAHRIIEGRTANERIQRMRQRADDYRLLVKNQNARERQCRSEEKPSSSFCLNEQIGNLTRLFQEFEIDFNETQNEIHHEQNEAKRLFGQAQQEYERVREQAALMARFADRIEAFAANLSQHTNDDPSSIINLIDRVYGNIDRFSMEPEQSIIQKTSQSASGLFNYLQSIQNELNGYLTEIEQFKNRIQQFEQRTNHLENHLQQAADKLGRISGQISSLDDITLIRTKLKQSRTLKESTDEQLGKANEAFAKNLRDQFNQLENLYRKTLNDAESLNTTVQMLVAVVQETHEQNRRIRTDVRQIHSHVRNLTETSSFLESLFNNMRQQHNVTLLTAFVYRDIIDTVNLLDSTSTELRRNFSDAQQHLRAQRERIDELQRIQFEPTLSSTSNKNNAVQLDTQDEQRLDRAMRTALNFNRSVQASEKLISAYKLRIDELKSTANNLEPSAQRMLDESRSKTNEFLQLRERILGEKPMNASSLSDRPLQMEFADITDSISRMKRWQTDTDEQLSLAKFSFDQTIELQENLAEIIADIRRLVDESRSIVSSVRVGAQFNRSSAVNLHRPYSKSQVNLNKQHSKIALSFRTSEPDGLLAYAGSGNEDRYMSLRLNAEGQVEFTYDLGQQRPMTIVTPRKFNDNQWYDVTGERFGSHGQLTVVNSTGQDVFLGTHDAETSGQSILDLSEENSVFLIGGVPSQISLKNPFPSFAGSISNVRLDEQSVSLWNFQSAMNYNQGSIPSTIHREALPGIGLKGDGFLIFSRRRLRRLEHSFVVTIIFKTNTPNGLLLAYGGGDIEKRFFAVQIIDSHPEILMNTGSGLVSLRLEDNVHDNRLHRLQIKKQNRDLIVQLDNQPTQSISDRDEESRIEGGNENIYVGKYLGQDSLRDAITSRGFSGCIQSILIDRTELTFKSEHFKRSENVETTCSLEQILRTVQFNYLDQESYVEVAEKNLTVPWAITARFHSNQPSGTLIYMKTDENLNDDALVVFYDQNHLMLKDKNVDGLSCETPLSSHWWNYVSVYRDARSYRLYINDSECAHVDLEVESNQQQLYKTVFVGGIPQTLGETRPRLIGCIGDVNIDGSLVNFNNVIKLKNAEQNCQTNGISSTANTNQRDTLVYPAFVYNATAPAYPNRYQLKLLQFNDEMENRSGIIPAWPSVTAPILIEEIVTSTSTSTTTIVDEADEDEEGSSRRQRRSCSLPTIPSADRGEQIGFRFGDDHRESRAQITILDPSISQSMNISFNFRTRFAHGLLFYSGSDVSNEFIALWLHKGRVVFAFDCGSGKGEIESIHHFNDDQWHQIDVQRQGNNATLFIDSQSQGFITPPGTKFSLESDGVFHFGNVPSTEGFLSARRRQIHHFKTRHHHLQFQGCLTEIEINQRAIPFDEQTKENIRSCYQHEESGVFLNGQKELILEESFPLGQRFNISFQFKSRVKSGLLLAATSRNEDNYFFVYLDKGNIVVTLLQNNIDEMHVVHWPSENNDHEVCNGQWHNIEIEKDVNFVRLHVDQYEPDEESLINEFDVFSNGPLYVGGMASPPAIIDDIPAYIGCLTNLKITAIDDDSSARHASPLHSIDGIEYSCPTN